MLIPIPRFKIYLLAFVLCFLQPALLWAVSDTSEKELFLIAEKAFDDGFYDVAIRYIDEYLNTYPQTEKRVEANLLLGQCYFFKTQYLKAFDIFQGLLQSPQFKDATLFWLAETYLKGSDYLQAEKNYRQLLSLYPDSVYTPQAHYSLAWVFYDQRKYEDAIQEFLTLQKKFPAHALVEDAVFKLGECSYNLKSYDDAIEYFRKYVLSYPKSIRHDQAYFYIAEASYYLGNFSSAVEYYGKAAEISKDSKLIVISHIGQGWASLKIKSYEPSKQYFDKAMSIAQSKGILSDDIFLGQASLYSETNEPFKALSAYEQVIEKFSNSSRISEALLGKANTLYLMKEYDQAVHSYQAIVDKFSNQADYAEIVEKARFGLAWTYLKVGNVDNSIQSFRDVMDQTQNKIVKVSALTQIGDAYQDAKKFDKALDVYDQILRNYPDSLYSDYVQFRQGIVLLRMDKVEAAILSLKGLKTNFSQSKYLKDANYYLGVAYFKKGDWAASRDWIDIFLKDLNRNNEFVAEAYYIVALSTFNLGDSPKAMELFTQIIKNYPDQPAISRDAEIGIAKCLFNLGDTKEAVKRFKIIIYKYPQSETAQEAIFWLAEFYLKLSEIDNAIAYYQQLLRDFPDSEKTGIAHFQLGMAFQSQGLYDKALNQLKFIDDPSHKELYAKAKLAIADIFSKELDTENAIQTYENIAVSCPDFKRDAYVKIASMYKGSQKFEKAAEIYQKALSVDQNLSEFINPQLQFDLGDTYEMNNQLDMAIETYLKIPYLYPKEILWVTKAYLRLGRIFEDKGDFENAKTIYRKVIALGTDEMKFAQERLEWIDSSPHSQSP